MARFLVLARLFVFALAGVLAATLTLPSAVLADPGEDDPIVDRDLRSAIPLEAIADADDGGSSPTGTGQPPRVGPNARTNAPQAAFPNGLLGRSETTVASTDDGQLVVVGFNDAQGFCGPPFGVACTPQTPPGLSGYAYSSDGGLTWTDGGGPPVFGQVLTRGDPWLARGGTDGQTFFYANLAVHAQTGASLGISVHRGAFSGSTFTWSDVRVFNSPKGALDFYDKEAVAARPGAGDAYVSVTNFQELCGNPQFGFGQIEVWRTHDGGETWQGPAIAGPESADSVAACGFSGTLQQSSVPAAGPNGEVYVVWSKGPFFTASGATTTDVRIMFARSLDGGVTFSAPTDVASGHTMRNNSPVGYNRDRINDHPRVAVATSGPDRGRVYVAYYDPVAPVTAAAVSACPAPLTGNCRGQRLTSSQVFVKHSDDQGATWSAAVPVAPAPAATGTKRFWPVVSVQPGGNLDVVYYESQETPVASGAFCQPGVASGLRRRGTAHSLVNTLWVRSIDGGATFEAPISVSTATSDWCLAQSNIRPNFGDYIGATSGGDRVLATWADSRGGVAPVDTFFGAGLSAGKAR